MTATRLLLAFPLLLVLAVSLAACGGEDALSDEEYFQRMDEIDNDLDAQFEEVFGTQGATAGELKEGFSSAVDSARAQYSGLEPPDDVKGEHEELVAAAEEYDNALTAAEVDADAPPEEFEAVFADEDLSAAEERLTNAFCAIQDIADEKNIEADVGCEDGEEQPDPSTIEPVETNDVLMEDNEFDPPHIQVAVGDTVSWTQGVDEEAHTVTADDETFDSGIIEPEGEPFQFTFEEAGEFPYFCEIHPDMLGLVTVTE